MSHGYVLGTSYSNHDISMIPIYLFYSMFDFKEREIYVESLATIVSYAFNICDCREELLAGEGFNMR